MNAWVRLVRHRRRLAAASQGGYLLMMTIAVIGFLGILVVALLGMLFTDLSTRSVYARQERDRRAVDGALQVGIDRLKTSPNAVLGGATGCGSLDGGAVSIEQRNVTLKCSTQSVTDPPVASPGGPTDGPVLTLLSNYNGQLDDAAAGSAGSYLNGAIGGLLAAGLNALLKDGPGLVHFGPEPLQIVGDVGVKQTAFGKKDPAPSPAISVTGNYRQGDRGPLGNESFSIFGSPPLTTGPCGLLDRGFGSGPSDLGLQLHATGTEQCDLGRGNITGPTFNAPATFTQAQRVAGTPLPAAGCVAGSVVTFTPGAYNRTQTATMNQWFAGMNGCVNVTFYFPPGDYFFDVGGFFNNDRNSLTFNSTSSNWVFGTPRGWSPPSRATAANFPEACSRTAAGVSITTSSRTAIKHYGGQIAICGTPGSSTKPTIFQESGGTNQVWAGTAKTATAPGTGVYAFTSAVDATTASAPAPSTFPNYGSDWDTSEPTRRSATFTCGNPDYCLAGLTFGGFSDATETAPSGLLTSAVVKIRGDANVPQPWEATTGNPPYPPAATRVIVSYGDGSGRSCTVNVSNVPRGNTDFSVPLYSTTNPLGACNNDTYQLTDASQLENATIEVAYQLPRLFCFFGCPNSYTPWASIDYVWLETNTGDATSSSYSTVVDPPNGKSLNVFGPVYLPKSNIEIGWLGAANVVPTFVGQVVARGMGSLNLNSSVRVGVVAARTLVQPGRHVTLRAVIDGRLRGTAEVVITDTDTTGKSLSPGRLLKIVDWNHCNKDQSATSC